MIKKGSEVPGMAKPKETQRPMEENKIYKLNMTPFFSYIPARKYNGAAKGQALSTITLLKIHLQRKIRLGTYIK